MGMNEQEVIGGPPSGAPIDAPQPSPAAPVETPAPAAPAVDTVVIPESAAKGFGHLTKVLQDRQREIDTLKQENANLKGGGSTTPPADPVKAELASLPKNEAGHVLYEGTYVPESFAARQIENAHRLDDLSSKFQSFTSGQIESQSAAQIQAVRNELETNIVNVIKETRASVLPGIPAEQVGEVDEYIALMTNHVLNSHTAAGNDLSQEVIVGAIQQGITKAKSLFGAVGTAQIKDNRDYQSRFRMRPSGPPGVSTPKTVSQMTNKEREAAADQAAYNAERRRG